MNYTTIALIAGAVLAVGSAQAGTLNGTFDGHCDGFALTTSANGAAFGSETGCVTGAAAGRTVKKFRGGAAGGGAVVNLPHVANAVFEINTTSHTYAIYTSSGSILETGTWTPAAAAAAAAAEDAGLPATGSP